MTEQAVIANNESEEAQSGIVLKEIKQVIYDSRTEQVYKIWLLNLFMNIMTLGIYSFWGKTRLRQYIVGSFSLHGDRFEYTGTGKELFFGFLKAVTVLLGIYAPFMIATLNAPDAAWPALFLITVIYVIPVALYSALRYRLSRLDWRGIRFRLTGSSLNYANLYIWRGVLDIISLGILLPYSDIKKYRHKVENSSYGDIPFSFEGHGKNLMNIHLATYAIAIGLLFMMLLGLQLIAVSFPYTDFSMAPQGISALAVQSMPEENSLPLLSEKSVFITAVTFILLPFLLFPLVRLMYKTALIHEMINHSHVAGIGFRSTVTTLALVKLKLGNFFIIIGTLGIGAPYIMQRNLRFFANHMQIKGDPETSKIRQITDQKPADAEGLHETLNLDADLI
ncbi:MAG: hypothetical protein NMNS01_08540 [Nitrosomonas sp.]|nr:MAG: hypothetical protein NMNS01_08540 [Nitrosomonas sp.]